MTHVSLWSEIRQNKWLRRVAEYIYIYLYVYIHTETHIYRGPYICAHIYPFIRNYTHLYIHISLWKSNFSADNHFQLCAYLSTYPFSYKLIYICRHMHITPCGREVAFSSTFHFSWSANKHKLYIFSHVTHTFLITYLQRERKR